jgi:hypothetical protein
VPPPLLIKSEVEMDEDSGGENPKDERTIYLNNIISSGDNYVIYGKSEFGKTTLLKQIALTALRKQTQSTKKLVPCFVSFSDIKIGTDRLLGLLRSQLPDCVPEGFTFRDVVSAGNALILVDDFDFSDTKRCQQIVRFIKDYPKNRYVFTAESQLYEGMGAVASLDASVPFVNLSMKPFTHNNMRLLVEKWDDKGKLDKDQVLDKVVSNIVHINLPLTAVNGTILLTILETRSDFTPINHAVLIERFVETLLEKNTLNEARRSQFDFRNKTHYLAFVAGYMVESDTYKLDYDQLHSISASYFKKIGLKEQSREQIDNFVAAKILLESDGKIGFRYRTFLEYFIALQMLESGEFKKFILEEERYLSVSNEIEYYAAIERNDSALIELIGVRFAELDGSIEQETGWRRDLSLINQIKSPHAEARESFFDEIERQLDAPPLSDKERDEILEAELPPGVGDRQEVFRPTYLDFGQKWTACLILYSGIVRNLELIEDHKKRKHLAAVLSGWSAFTFHSLLFIPALVKHRKLIINGVAYQVLMPKSMTDGEVARTLYLGMPRAVSDLIKQYVATEKLEMQLSEPWLAESTEPLIVTFYREHLYVDLKLPNFMDILKKLESKFAKSEYLLEAHLWKLRYMLPRIPLTPSQDKELRKRIASTVSRLLPGSHKSRIERRSKEIQRLEKAKLIEKLRVRPAQE